MTTNFGPNENLPSLATQLCPGDMIHIFSHVAVGTLINDDVRIAPPTEQPGMRRTHEIKLLYGSQSDKV